MLGLSSGAGGSIGVGIGAALGVLQPGSSLTEYPGLAISFTHHSEPYWAVQPGAEFRSWGVVGLHGPARRPRCRTRPSRKEDCAHVQRLLSDGILADPGSKHSLAPQVFEGRSVLCAQLCGSVEGHGVWACVYLQDAYAAAGMQQLYGQGL